MCNSNKNAVKAVLKIYDSNYLIYINKKDFSLKVYNRDLDILVNYKIGYGLNPDRKAKLYSGDNRTPEGIYHITEILSMDADKDSKSYKKLKRMNNIYFKASEGHYKFSRENEDLGYNAYGPRFFRINYPNRSDIDRYNKALKIKMIPKEKGKTPPAGSGLAIHGNNDIESIGQLCSSGCVRMHNEDIIKLDKYVQLNTPVVIVNE